MRVLKEYLLVIVVSFEFVVLLLGAAFFFFWPDERVILLSSKLTDNSEILKHVALLPLGIALWVFAEARKLLFPEEDSMKILQSWPDYWKWKIHFKVGLFYSLFFAVLGFITWVLGYKVVEAKGFVLLATSVIGGLVVAVSIYQARIEQSEIFIRKG